MRISDWSSDVCSSDLAGNRTLRNIALSRGDPKEPPLPYPVPEQVDEGRDVGDGGLAEIGNHVEGQGLGQRDGELHPLDSETRMDSLKPVEEQRRHLRATVARIGQARPNTLAHIIDPVKAVIKP